MFLYNKIPKKKVWTMVNCLLPHSLVSMPSLHSCRGYSSRLSRNCEWDKVRTNVDIHTPVRELQDRYNSWKSRDSRELAQFHSSIFFTKHQTTIYIQELNENVITVPSIMRQDIRDILISFDSGLICQHVSKSFDMRQEQVENVTDKKMYPLHSHSCLIYCCLDENVNQT